MEATKVCKHEFEHAARRQLSFIKNRMEDNVRWSKTLTETGEMSETTKGDLISLNRLWQRKMEEEFLKFFDENYE